MKTIAGWALVLCAFLCTASSVAAQTPVGALAVDERQGYQYGWAVDYETAGAARAGALGECGSACSVVLTFDRCGAYAADQDADSTAVGWAESYSSADDARQAALAECGSRGGTECIVRVWGCNGHVVEGGLGLDRAARREIQRGLQAQGFYPGGVDGMFGPRTRAAIRGWQASLGARATGYLDGASVAALRSSALGQPTFGEREPGDAASALPSAAPPAVSGVQPSAVPPTSAELEGLFWQSIVNSTDPADFEAYLEEFPNGVFRRLAENRLAALSTSDSAVPEPASTGVGAEARPRPGTAFRPDRTCAGRPAGTSCWMEISGQSECYVWVPEVETVTWTGECSGGLARGTGSLTLAWDDYESVFAGLLQDGKQTGHWVLRYPNGRVVDEGPFVDGERHGDWVRRWANGDVHEGPYVDGVQHGHWVSRYANGRVRQGPYVDGKQHGDWTMRWPGGTTETWRMLYGRRVD